MNPSINMKPVLKICEYGPAGELLKPLINIERDEIDFKKIDYASISPELKTALSWVYHLFCDSEPDEETWGYVDPFKELALCNSELRIKIIQALALRYGIEIKNEPQIIVASNYGPRVVGALFSNKSLAKALGVYENHGEILWEKIGYGGISGGYQTAISWAYSILNYKLPKKYDFRNPITNFGVMDFDLQKPLLQAFSLSVGVELK